MNRRSERSCGRAAGKPRSAGNFNTHNNSRLFEKKWQNEASSEKTEQFPGNPIEQVRQPKFVHLLFTAAVAKIPLSVVQVKPEPQYLVL
jgi:hypothetical protein